MQMTITQPLYVRLDVTTSPWLNIYLGYRYYLCDIRSQCRSEYFRALCELVKETWDTLRLGKQMSLQKWMGMGKSIKSVSIHKDKMISLFPFQWWESRSTERLPYLSGCIQTRTRTRFISPTRILITKCAPLQNSGLKCELN